MAHYKVYDCGCLPDADDWCDAAKKRKREARVAMADRGELDNIASPEANQLAAQARLAEAWVRGHLSEQFNAGKYRLLNGNGGRNDVYRQVASATAQSERVITAAGLYDASYQTPHSELLEAAQEMLRYSDPYTTDMQAVHDALEAAVRRCEEEL